MILGFEINITELLSGSFTVKKEIIFGTSVISEVFTFLDSIIALNYSKFVNEMNNDPYVLTGVS